MWFLSKLFEMFKAAQPEPEPDPLVTNRIRAVARARAMAAGPSLYILGAGGRDPNASTPFTVRDGRRGSDCVGFTSWCLGHDRFQPSSFLYYDGWINTDSLMMDADGRRSWYAQVAKPVPGDVVVFPSRYEAGVRQRIGHIGLVVHVPSDLPSDVYALPDLERRRWLLQVKIIDCAGSRVRRERGKAIAETAAAPTWDKPDAMFARCLRAP